MSMRGCVVSLLLCVSLSSCGGGNPLVGKWQLDPSSMPQGGVVGMIGALDTLLGGGQSSLGSSTLEFDKTRMIIDGTVNQAKYEVEDERVFVTLPATEQAPEESFVIDFLDDNRISVPSPAGALVYNRMQ